MRNKNQQFIKTLLFPLLCLIVIGFSAFNFFAGWKLKSGAEVRFQGGRISGNFETLKADIQFDKAHPEQAKISATVDANSLATGFFIKTSHAKDAIDADNHPNITFTATSVTKSGNGYQATGRLTLKGVSRTETIHFTFDDKGNEGVFKGGFKIIPKEYNITRSGTPDELNIYLTVPVSKS